MVVSRTNEGGFVPDERKNDEDEPERPEHRHYEIKIDREHFTTEVNEMTGQQLRELPDPDIGPDRDLWEVVPGDDDVKVELDTVVEIRNGKRFFTAPGQINPGCRS